MKKKYLVILISVAFLGGCGSSSKDADQASNPDKPTTNPPVETISKCDRGVLLNSILPAATTSIFDEPLYQFKAGYNDNQQIYIQAAETKRDAQMLYGQQQVVFNTTEQQLDDKQAKDSLDYILNTHGLFNKLNYQKQNQGWPTSYIVASQGETITTAAFNDGCDFKADTVNLDYEKVDLTGKKIADIFPEGVKDQSPEREDLSYLTYDTVYRLSTNKNAFSTLLANDAVFAQGSYAYVPKSVIYKDAQFYFGANSYAQVDSLEAWKAHYENPQYGGYKFKIDTVAGYKITYSVDQEGNELYYPGADPAMEKDGKIHDGMWIGKGNVISPTYGGPRYRSHIEKGQYTYFNTASYQFISQQIQAAYK